MYVSLLKSKIHRAAVTDSSLDYEGSLAIDTEMMQEVKMLPYEKILVANLNNGNRFETYAIPASAGSKCICLNGATAHLGKRGDRLIILSFASVESHNAAAHRPLVLVLDENNNPVKKKY